MIALLLVVLMNAPPTVVVDRDNIEIRESCTIEIQRDVIADTDGDGVIHIIGDRVTVDFAGQKLRGAKTQESPDSFAGIGVRIAARDVILKNAVISGYKTGVLATRSQRLTIEDCDVSENYRQRLKSTPAAEDQSDWLFPHKNDDNEWLKSHGAGIYLDECDGATVRRNLALHGQNGLCLRRVTDSEIYDNDFSFLSGWGIAMYRCSGLKINHNNCDFCVRGYSHGVYSRGQDSAGILMFEQCGNNVIAYNSATHSGDGFFGFAGNEALDGDVKAAKVGNNRNLLYGNDFSYAPAIGIEMTFSFHNVFASNRLSACNYGIWGGYSSNMTIVDNTIEENTLAGIAVEHGSQWGIFRDKFRANAKAIELWWDDDKDLLAKPWAKLNNTASVSYAVWANSFSQDRLGVELRGGATKVDVASNTWENVEPHVTADDLSAFTERELEREEDWKKINFSVKPDPSTIAGKREAIGLRKHLAGRDKIIITEWGPYDWKRPYLQSLGFSPAAGDLPARNSYRLLGDAKIEAVSIRPRAGATSDAVQVRRDAKDDAVIYVTSTGAPGEVSPYVVEVKAGSETLVTDGMLIAAEWNVRVFASNLDPRDNADEWRKAAASGVAFVTAQLCFAYGNGGPSELKNIDPAVAAAKLPKDRFGTIAETTLTIPAGHWKLLTTSDDGVRVWLNDKLVIDNWTHHVPTVDSAELTLDKPSATRIRIEHFELDGYAVLSFDLKAAEDTKVRP